MDSWHLSVQQLCVMVSSKGQFVTDRDKKLACDFKVCNLTLSTLLNLQDVVPLQKAARPHIWQSSSVLTVYLHLFAITLVLLACLSIKGHRSSVLPLMLLCTCSRPVLQISLNTAAVDFHVYSNRPLATPTSADKHPARHTFTVL